MEKHKFNFFPAMSPDDFAALKASIATGFDKTLGKIMLFDGQILDGWNRYLACQETGITPVFDDFAGDESAAFEYSIRANQDRRHLTKSQLAAVAIDAEPLWQAIQKNVEQERRRKISEARQRVEAEKGNVDEKEMNQLIDSSQRDIKEMNESATNHKLASTFGTNRQYIADAKNLKENNPEAFEAVKNGEKTLTEVKKDERIKQRAELIARQKIDIEESNLPELAGLFNVISVDPPWNYGREYDPENSRVANPYPEMTVQEIKDLKLPFTDDSILFLWTTHKFLPDAFDILKHWNFEYKATLVWDKQKMGMGAWFRMQCEFCLFAIKGNPFWNNTTERDIINEGRREHSRKPEGFFNMVDKICAGRKLEYFSREKREGWEIFGNDINKF